MNENTKTCRGCWRELALSEFHRVRRCPDGHNSKCRGCVNEVRRRHANPLGKRPGRPSQPLAARFWIKVDRETTPDGCWLWTGAKTEKGYGEVLLDATTKARAHRVAWELAFGPVSEDRCVLHHCDVPACVRPEHLFLGLPRDNTLDMLTKGRQSKRTVLAQVVAMRSLYDGGMAIADVARVMQLPYARVQKIVTRLTWRHVP